MPTYHESIMRNEVLHYLNIHMEGVIVDGTLGDGGHTEFILKNTGPKIRVLGIDRDQSAIERARERLNCFRDRVTFVHGSLENLRDIVTQSGQTKINGLLLDFGVSSPQLDTPERGFSIRNNGPLDMRMDNSQKTTAADLLEKLKDAELVSIIKNFGEERFAKKIVRAIRREQEIAPITTTSHFSEIISRVVRSPRHSRIHPATRTFQALRIAVNNELEQIKTVLSDAIQLLDSSARIVAISFHSLEDRIVKTFFRAEEKGCTCPPKIPICICGNKPTLKIHTRRPIYPSEEEIALNPRAISAKLRVAERIYV
ncbi:MAG: 16S rRNA (cytosine(1402)-N(4))-methyltransferase RsmH [Nitrospina sp.]|jgi:16S rRNA (cytosine1402-N4)-methyltransferase|nr:16S rRNA (cytosine(1402)-N(4))-methyltransferase RsmH [Nitrospina sp.]